MLINMPLPGQFGLNPVANIIDITTKQILISGVTLIETTPGNYSANIDIPSKNIPLPLKKDEDITIPLIPPQPKPSSVIISVTIPGIGIATASNILTPHYAEPIIITQKPIEVDGAIRCPYCFSKIDLPHDPLIFIWSDDPTLCLGNKIMEQYKGCMQIKANHIKELQDNRKNLEESLGIIPLTEFSPIDTTYFYQNLCSYILELRESTEKILEAVGISKDTYFNYNEYGTEMRINHQLDWIDAIDLTSEELVKFQVKSLHIEDLRHHIINSIFMERWNIWQGESYNIENSVYFKGDFGNNSWVAPLGGEVYSNLESLTGSSLAGNYSMSKKAQISGNTLLIKFFNSVAINQIAPNNIAFVYPGTCYPFHSSSEYLRRQLKIGTNLFLPLSIRPIHSKFTFDLSGLTWTPNHITIGNETNIYVNRYVYPEFRIYIIFLGTYTKYHIIYKNEIIPHIEIIGNQTYDYRALSNLSSFGNILNLDPGWTKISYIEFSLHFTGMGGQVIRGIGSPPISVLESTLGTFLGGLDNIGLV